MTNLNTLVENLKQELEVATEAENAARHTLAESLKTKSRIKSAITALSRTTSSTVGKPLSPEHKLKISAALAARKAPPPTPVPKATTKPLLDGKQKAAGEKNP